ncbi:MAG: prolyl-tRNA synthetase associated domain-containing protein [Clostridia bacterium]|nr:prolyl-tRNA synthetase associated domain-containing protein [Clostridia bacterium]
MTQNTLYHGRPVDEEGRLEKELRVYDFLDGLGIGYDFVDTEPATTMEVCAEVDKLLAPAVICKNLFLCNRQKTDFYLLMIKNDKKFKTKEISGQLGVARLSFADAEYMEEFLDIEPGAVSVLGLMNDKDNKVRLIVDEDVLKAEYFGCHPCVNTTSMRMKVADVFGPYLDAVHHDYTTVHLEGEEW